MEIQKLIARLDDANKANYLAIEIHKLLAKFGDGHTKIVGLNEFFPSGYLPFKVEHCQEKVVCLKAHSNQLLDDEYPFLKAINGISVEKLLKESGKLIPDGSIQLQIQFSVSMLANIEYLLQQLDAVSKDGLLQIELENEQGETHSKDLNQSTKPLVSKEQRVMDILFLENRILSENIGYLKIPSMLLADEDNVQETLAKMMSSLTDTRGLIIDIRSNPGGSRDILRYLAPYFISNDHDPIVANVAAFRTDDQIPNNEGYLDDRYLYPVTSNEFSENDRRVIQKFTNQFIPEWKIPNKKFSQWHYFLVKPDHNIPHYNKPVVLLINSRCFSAADIFAAAFKELPNVTLVGTPTAGGSGRAQRYTLPNSGIEIKLSSMASFQPDGRLYDGNGVTPDIEVSLSLSNILENKDRQLEEAIELIRKSRHK